MGSSFFSDNELRDNNLTKMKMAIIYYWVYMHHVPASNNIGEPIV